MSLQVHIDSPLDEHIVIAKLGYGKADDNIEVLGKLFGLLVLPLLLVCRIYFAWHTLWIVPAIFFVPYLAISINARRGKLWLKRRGGEFTLIRDPYKSAQTEEIPVAGIQYGWNYESIHHQSSNGGLYRKADGSTIVPIGDTRSCGLTVVFYGVEDEKSVPKLALHQDLSPWVDNPSGWKYLPVDELLGVQVYPIYGSLKSFVNSIEEEREYLSRSNITGRNAGTFIRFDKSDPVIPQLKAGE